VIYSVEIFFLSILSFYSAFCSACEADMITSLSSCCVSQKSLSCQNYFHTLSLYPVLNFLILDVGSTHNIFGSLFISHISVASSVLMILLEVVRVQIHGTGLTR